MSKLPLALLLLLASATVNAEEVNIQGESYRVAERNSSDFRMEMTREQARGFLRAARDQMRPLTKRIGRTALPAEVNGAPERTLAEVERWMKKLGPTLRFRNPPRVDEYGVELSFDDGRNFVHLNVRSDAAGSPGFSFRRVEETGSGTVERDSAGFNLLSKTASQLLEERKTGVVLDGVKGKALVGVHYTRIVDGRRTTLDYRRLPQRGRWLGTEFRNQQGRRVLIHDGRAAKISDARAAELDRMVHYRSAPYKGKEVFINQLEAAGKSVAIGKSGAVRVRSKERAAHAATRGRARGRR